MFVHNKVNVNLYYWGNKLRSGRQIITFYRRWAFAAYSWNLSKIDRSSLLWKITGRYISTKGKQCPYLNPVKQFSPKQQRVRDKLNFTNNY